MIKAGEVLSSSNDENAFIGHVYLRELTDVVAEHEIKAKILGKDWTEEEQESATKGYQHLNDTASEVGSSFHRTYLTMNDIQQRIGHHVIQPYADQQSSDSRLNKLWHTHGTQSLKYISAEEKDPSSGLPFIIYVNALIDRFSGQATYTDPQLAIEKMEHTVDVSLHPILRAAMDFQIFNAARKGMDYTVALPKANFASSHATYQAMQRGLGLRVLSTLYNLKFGQASTNMDADSFIAEHASSERSAEILRSHIGGRALAPSGRYPYQRRIPSYMSASFQSIRLNHSQTGLRHEIRRLKKEGNTVAAELVGVLKRADARQIELNALKMSADNISLTSV